MSRYPHLPKRCKTCHYWKASETHNCLKQLGMLVINMREGFEAVCKTDKTPIYKYGQYRPDITAPLSGSKWLTPKEIAEEQLKRFGARLEKETAP